MYTGVEVHSTAGKRLVRDPLLLQSTCSLVFTWRSSFLKASVSIDQFYLPAAAGLPGKCILQVLEEKPLLFHILFGSFVYPQLRD